MSSDLLGELPSLSARRLIDAQCDAYERAWVEGRLPRLGDFVAAVSPDARQHALLELVAVELEYARNERGERLTHEQVVARHPEFADELKRIVDQFPTLQVPAGDGRPKAPATLRATGSRGLHIRCPHCQVALELLADAPLNAINCSGCGSNFSLIDGDADNSASRTLQQIGRFQLLSRIGIGGFGTVWKAHDAELDRAVALKIPRKGQLSAKEEEFFFREARAAAQLRHSNIVPVHEVGRDGDTIFIVSDLILGESLANWLREQHPSTRDMVVLLAKVADALHFAHEHGIVHRDFKPSNVVIDQQGEPHLMDFGLAKREVGEVTMTIDGQVVGTPAYMSPEQAAGSTHWVDRRTDIYSLGVVLFEVLTGELPFRGNAQMQIRERLSADAPNPRRLNQRAPIDLATICLRCLEREPNRRYNTAREVAEELRRYLNREPILARPISRFGRLVRWSRRNPAPAAAIALAAILAVAGPITAVVINSQRSMLASRVDEIQRLVKDGERKLDERAMTIESLTKERDALVGVAASDARGDSDDYRMAAHNLVENRRDTISQLLNNESTQPEQKARGHLGFAYLFASLNKRDAALPHLTAAIKALETKLKSEPNVPTWKFGLADCYNLMAVLDEENNASSQVAHPAVVRSHWRSQIRESDAIQRVKTSIEKIGQLTEKSESELTPAHNDLVTNWPSGPDELYEVACFLTDRYPTLLRLASQTTTTPSD